MRGKRLTTLGEQHITVDERGDIAGVLSIDGTRARAFFGNARFWEGVEHVINEYTVINPAEMEAIRLDNAVTKTENRNDLGSSTTGTVRHCISIPYGLLLVLEEYEPTLFTNKKTRRQFMRLFPGLRACKTI